MRRSVYFWYFLWVLPVIAGAKGVPQHLYRYLDVSQKHLLFTCGNRLWITDRKGRQAQPLSDQPGIVNPRFSPDGRSIAYSATVNDNTDVYVISLPAGKPRRLTWHPGADRFRSWNGNRVIYSSAKNAAPARYTELFEIGLESGSERKLPFAGAYCQVSPDSSHTAFVVAEDMMETGAFKQYRGGNHQSILLRSNPSGKTIEIPNEGWNDLNPVYSGSIVYFISDRDGLRNLYSYVPSSGIVKQHTHFRDFDIHSLSSCKSLLAFEKGGELFLLDPQKDKIQQVSPYLPKNTTFPERSPYQLQGKADVRSVTLSPDGRFLAMDNHGDVLIKPADSSQHWNNLTANPIVHEQQPAWGPDSRLAYLSDKDGEYRLIVRFPGTSKPIRSLNLGKGYFTALRWSPDGTKIALTDHQRRLLIAELLSGKISTVAQDSFSVRSGNLFNYSWSPASRLLAYQVRTRNQLNRIALYNTTSGATQMLRTDQVDARFPVISADGKRIYFGVCRDNSLGMGELDMSAFGRDRSWDIYAAELPIQPNANPRKITGGVRNLRHLELTKNGDLLFLADKEVSCLMSCSSENGTPTMLRTGVNDYQSTAGGDKILCKTGSSYQLLEINKSSAAQTIDLNDLTVCADPAAEWKNGFAEGLRLIRDFFRGSTPPDLKTLQQKYATWLDKLTCREDYKYLLRQLLGELQSSHTYFYSPDLASASDEKIGLLGADWEISNGHYRLKKIWHGDPWGSTAPNPFDQANVPITAGDYLRTVNGRPVTSSLPIEAWFTGTAGKNIILSFSESTSATNEKQITLTPLHDDADLRRWQWVERNRFLVDSASKGRTGYLYLSDTHRPGYQSLNLSYAGLAGKEYLLIDARFNAGGYFPDYLIEMLARKPLLQFLRNDAAPLKEPLLTAPDKMLLLVNQRTVSGGEILTAEFQKRGLGRIAGTRTAGLGNPFTGDHQLLDGTVIVLPTLELADLQGNWIVENRGMVPDIQLPADPEQPCGETQLLNALKHLLSNPQ